MNASPDADLVVVAVLAVLLAALAVHAVWRRRRPTPVVSRLLETAVRIPAGHPERWHAELHPIDEHLALLAERTWPDYEYESFAVCPTPSREGQTERPSLLAARCLCGLFHPDRRRPRARRRRWWVWRRQAR